MAITKLFSDFICEIMPALSIRCSVQGKIFMLGPRLGTEEYTCLGQKIGSVVSAKGPTYTCLLKINTLGLLTVDDDAVRPGTGEAWELARVVQRCSKN